MFFFLLNSARTKLPFATDEKDTAFFYLPSRSALRQFQWQPNVLQVILKVCLDKQSDVFWYIICHDI